MSIDDEIKKIMAEFFGVFNDKATRELLVSRLLDMLPEYLEFIRFKCDESNNTPEVVESCDLVVGVCAGSYLLYEIHIRDLILTL